MEAVITVIGIVVCVLFFLGMAIPTNINNKK